MVLTSRSMTRCLKKESGPALDVISQMYLPGIVEPISQVHCLVKVGAAHLFNANPGEYELKVLINNHFDSVHISSSLTPTGNSITASPLPTSSAVIASLCQCR